MRNGEPWAELSLGMAGEHNALNASAAAALAAGQGIDVESIRLALETFASVKRRLEIRAEVNGTALRRRTTLTTAAGCSDCSFRSSSPQ